MMEINKENAKEIGIEFSKLNLEVLSEFLFGLFDGLNNQHKDLIKANKIKTGFSRTILDASEFIFSAYVIMEEIVRKEKEK